MSGRSGERRRHGGIPLILSFLLLAVMLGGWGYLLRVRAVHCGRLADLRRQLAAEVERSRESTRVRDNRVEFHLNQFLSSFPRRQSAAAVEWLSRVRHSGAALPLLQVSLRAGGTGMAFRITWSRPDNTAAARVEAALDECPLVARMDRCPSPEPGLRGTLEIP